MLKLRRGKCNEGMRVRLLGSHSAPCFRAKGSGRMGAVSDQGVTDVTSSGALTNQRTRSCVTSVDFQMPSA
jgi:hypothetical protein